MDAKSSKHPDGADILDWVVGFLQRFVVFANAHQPVVVALWVLHTHAFAACESTPYLLVTSPEKRSGKSRLLEVLELLVRAGWMISGASEAVLFRKIEKDCPTLLLDETDAIFAAHTEKTEPIRGLLDAGSRRGGTIARCAGKNHEVADFATFCPKGLAGIDNGRHPETIRDRSIVIRLQRKLFEQVERFRYRKVKAEAEILVKAITTWAEAHLNELADLYPEIPEELNDRAAEGWEPLLAIAEVAGTEWLDRGRAAAVALSGNVEVEEDSFGVQLLADLKRIWVLDELGSSPFSHALCEKLHGVEDGPWTGWGKGRPMPGFNARDLARTLRPFGIKPRTVRVGEITRKGYHREQFADAWARYVPEDDNEDDAS
jgi:Protein of unknown function (DUF3631)